MSAVLVLALLLCHGVLGGMHQVSWPAAPEGPRHAIAGHEMAVAPQGHAVGQSQDHRAGHPMGTPEYAAVLFVLLLGTALALLSGAVPLHRRAIGLKSIGRASSPAGLPPPRGPTLPMLQVFQA